MNQNIDEKNNNTGIKKKKRIHRSEMEEECDDSYKAKSVEPNENDNDNVTTSINNLDTNDSLTDVEDDDLMVNSKQKGKMQQELDQN